MNTEFIAPSKLGASRARGGSSCSSRKHENLRKFVVSEFNCLKRIECLRREYGKISSEDDLSGLKRVM